LGEFQNLIILFIRFRNSVG